MERHGRVQAIDRAVMILKCFSEKRQELRLSDIADELDLNRSTAHGIISTLKYHGLIDQDEITQKYRLGLFLMELGNIINNSLDIRSISAPIIEEVCNEIEETVHIGALDNHEIIYIDKMESTQSMRIFTTIGARNPAYSTGVGKVMLAYLDEEQLLDALPESLEKFTEKTITDKDKLMHELAKVREKGYSMDNEENIAGLTCVAAPIFDQFGKVKYGISISGPTIRMTEEKIVKAIDLVKKAAEQISKELGFKE